MNTKRVPFHNAVEMDNWDLVNLLLEHNADANVRDVKGQTPLELLAQVSQSTRAKITRITANIVVFEAVHRGSLLPEREDDTSSAVWGRKRCSSFLLSTVQT